MVKSYLKYIEDKVVGVISSSEGGLAYAGPEGKMAATGCLEFIALWDVRRGERVATLAPSDKSGQVCALTSSLDGKWLASGYTDGKVRVWSMERRECTAQFNGHKKAVTCLSWSADGCWLVSGSRDTNLILWDVVGERGVCRLKGHTDSVTAVRYLDARQSIVSASKDGFVRLWDIDTQHCVQTLVGHRQEIWSLCVTPDERRLIVGSLDQKLRVWTLLAKGDEQDNDDNGDSDGGNGNDGKRKRERLGKGKSKSNDDDSSDNDMVGNVRAVFFGELKRRGTGRVTTLAYSDARQTGADASSLLCQAADKTVEVFRVHTPQEVAKRARKRRTKQRRLLRKRKEKLRKESEEAARARTILGQAAASTTDASDDDDDNDGDAARDAEPAKSAPSDEMSTQFVLRAAHKVASGAFNPRAPQLVLSLANNRLETYNFDGARADKLSTIDLPGHRSGIRAVALSSDSALVASTSRDQVKIWNARSMRCVRTLRSGYGMCVTFLPGNRHVVIGTKEGNIELFDIASGDRVHVEEGAHASAIWSVAVRPNQRGMLTGSADKALKFWDFTLVDDVAAVPSSDSDSESEPEPESDVESAKRGGKKHLSLSLTHSVEMNDDVMCVRYSVDQQFVAVALLDYTVKVFYEDTMKFFLSLYGHKLPVLSLDMSDDSALMVTGSADKNVKIWGLDFGDCHKSLFAHDDSVMQVRFVRQTHYFFSAGKDRVLKYWDADTFQHVTTLRGHWGEVWALGIARGGDFVVSGSHDRSLRVWRRTDEMLFLQEERERELDELFESTLEQQRAGLEGDADELESAPATKRTLDTIKAGERLIEAIDLAMAERAKFEEFELAKRVAAERGVDPSTLNAPTPEPALGGLSPHECAVAALASIRSPDLEEALMVIPFTGVIELFGHLRQCFDEDCATERALRCVVFLLKVHHQQIASTGSLASTLVALQSSIRANLQSHKDRIGFNRAAIQYCRAKVEHLVEHEATLGAADSNNDDPDQVKRKRVK
jgi:U3 small nucleolar RNA-associated protein 12